MTIEIDKLKSFFPEIDKALISDTAGQFDLSLARLGSYIYVNQNDVFEALQEKKDRQNPRPLTLDELHDHLSKRHPYEIEPLYVVFNPPISIDYAPRWRDAYNLSQLLAVNAKDYGKTWFAYRYPPKEA